MWFPTMIAALAMTSTPTPTPKPELPFPIVRECKLSGFSTVINNVLFQHYTCADKVDVFAPGNSDPDPRNDFCMAVEQQEKVTLYECMSGRLVLVRGEPGQEI